MIAELVLLTSMTLKPSLQSSQATQADAACTQLHKELKPSKTAEAVLCFAFATSIAFATGRKCFLSPTYNDEPGLVVPYAP